jgi:molecular chaperone DnaJ
MDPYEILGLSPGASDDEVKKAYRALAKKYHPDANPGDKVAEQKMKDINAAYDMIINKKYRPQSSNPFTGGGQSQSYYGSSQTGQGPQQTYAEYDEDPFDFSSFGFGPFSAFFYGDQNGQSAYSANPYGSGAGDTQDLARARERILARDYVGALRILGSIRLVDRNARWYYYSAIANEGAGNRIQARQDAAKAVQIEPGNSEYQTLYRQLNGQSQTYNQTSHGYRAPAFGLGGICLTWFITNLLCRMMGGAGVSVIPFLCCC